MRDLSSTGGPSSANRSSAFAKPCDPLREFCRLNLNLRRRGYPRSVALVRALGQGAQWMWYLDTNTEENRAQWPYETETRLTDRLQSSATAAERIGHIGLMNSLTN